MEIIKTSDPFKTGYLQIPPQGFLKKSKSWTKRFYALYEASDDGIQRLEMFDNEENYYRKSQSSSKIVPMTDCVKVTTVTQKQQNNLFEVVTKKQTFLFSAENHQEMNDWVSAFRNVAFGSTNNTLKLAPLIFNSAESNLSSSSSFNEENMIYSSVDAPEVYLVRVGDCEVKTRLKLNSTYHLLITSVGISLTENGIPSQKSPFLTWAYRHIRRYGYSNETFSFEAGRKSASGEGLFIFETKDGGAIFQSTASHVNLLKSCRSESDLVQNPSPADDKKAFFPGTSPKKNNSLLNMQSTDREYGEITPNKTKLAAPIAKPPRKPKSNFSDSDSYPMYEDPSLLKDPKGRKKSSSSIGKGEFLYDFPEERSDAWKTLGCDVDDDVYDLDVTDPGYECVTVTRHNKELVNREHNPSSIPQLPTDESSTTYAKVKARNKEIIKPDKTSTFKPPLEPNEIIDECGSPYENMMVEKQPAHFIFNETEYAQVIRKKT